MRSILLKGIILAFVIATYGQALDFENLQGQQTYKQQLGVSGRAINSGVQQAQEQIKQLKTAQQLASQRLKQLQYSPVDGPIDGDKYLVGPYDMIRIQVWAAITIDELTEVTPDGAVVIPGYGPVNVAGLTWNQAKQKIEQKIKEAYKPKRYAVTLAAARVFWVNITGAVKFPGSYQLGATQRLWDLIQLAGGPDGIADLGNVKIFRKNGDTLTVDMTPYFAEGNLAGNPYLFGGDVVFLPPVNSENGLVRVYGTGIRNGYYGLKPKETVRELAQRLRVFAQSSEFSRVEIIRRDSVMSINLLSQDVPLTDGDIVIFPAHLDSVIVGGLVLQGGSYPYYPGLSPYQYIAMAGGPTEKGSEKNFSIYRNGKKIKLKKGEFIRPGDVIIVHHSNFDRFKDWFETLARIASSSFTIYYLIDRLSR